jgi:hypothetical protein
MSIILKLILRKVLRMLNMVKIFLNSDFVVISVVHSGLSSRDIIQNLFSFIYSLSYFKCMNPILI